MTLMLNGKQQICTYERLNMTETGTDLQTGVGPVVVGAVLTGDASGRATLTLVPEAHSPLLGLLEDLDIGLGHCRAETAQGQGARVWKGVMMMMRMHSCSFN